jgi:tRNA(Ile2) C34 agmatinyltransferase TiaS
VRCKLCGGPTTLLGVLGALLHYRCRSCGAMFSKRSKKKAEGSIDHIRHWK